MSHSPLSLRDSLLCARETHALEIGTGQLARVPGVFRQHFGDRQALIVADPNTFAAAGQAVLDAFRSTGSPACDPFIFRDPGFHASYPFVEQLEAHLRERTAIPVAVGSGSLNDITKLAAHRTGRSYLAVATAASMDGYTAFGASITFQGAKQTFSCPAPMAIVADLDVIAAAPPLMNASGYADLLAKVVAGADWIAADALGVDPIDAKAWDIVQGRLRELVADPAGVRGSRPEALARLLEGLMVGGFAMQCARSSRPASGAEHQFSHLWDMQHHTWQGRAPSHGFKVGIGTLAITALYERLLEQPFERLDVDRCCRQWLDAEAWVDRARHLLGPGDVLAVAAREIPAKQVTPDQLRVELERLRAIWPELRARLRGQLLPLKTLRQMLEAAGAPVEPEQIGISRRRLRRSYWQAFCIRRRFTALDLAVRTGLLDQCLDDLFGPAEAEPGEAAHSHNPALP